MQSVKDFDVEKKRILVRCDFNIPLDKEGNILDDTKIREALPTLQYLLDKNAKIVIITHLGDGNEILDGVVAQVTELLGQPVKKIGNFEIPNDQIVMLENIRSHKEETDNEEGFAKQLAALGDIYINEAFDVCHRAHASVVGIPKFLPHGAGFALEKEVGVLSQIMQHPERPMIAIIGGAKAETKVQFVDAFCAFADVVIVSGLIKQELVVKKIPLKDPEKVLGPKQALTSLDLAPEDIQRITDAIMKAKTVCWNGPFGKIEDPQYTHGTRAIAKAIIERGAYSVVGGGETVEFLHKEGILGKFSHVSTAGGAMLEFLSGQQLPGLKALGYYET